jgi:hypothetical protein
VGVPWETWGEPQRHRRSVVQVTDNIRIKRIFTDFPTDLFFPLYLGKPLYHPMLREKERDHDTLERFPSL